MLLVLSTAAAMVLWVILWALGAKGFDAFLVALLLVLIAGTVSLMLPYLPGRRRASDQTQDPAPFN
jgi:hypothetical protein